jgi:hypothetical protein
MMDQQRDKAWGFALFCDDARVEVGGRSISAARGRSFFWTDLISIVCSAAPAWLVRHGLAWLRVG